MYEGEEEKDRRLKCCRQNCIGGFTACSRQNCIVARQRFLAKVFLRSNKETREGKWPMLFSLFLLLHC